MKIILMRCNVEKELKKELKKQQKKQLENIISLKNIRRLEKMSKEEQEKYFDEIDTELENTPKADFEKLYLNYFLVEKKMNNNKVKKYSKEVACTIEEDNLLKEKYSFIKDKHLNNRFINTTKKVMNKLSKILGNKYVKKLLFASLSIALSYTCKKMEYSTIACATGGAGASIDTAFFYIRSISGIICFICMTIEIVQNAVQGDVRVIWYVVAKYLAIMVAILSFRRIFNIIDDVFNG